MKIFDYLDIADVNREIGNRIKSIRENKKIEVKVIADEIGIQPTSLSKIEREGTNNLKTLFSIAKALKVRVVEFFEDSYIVSEPKEHFGAISREEWIQSDLNLKEFIRNELAKNKELPVKKDSYKLHNKPRKTPRNK